MKKVLIFLFVAFLGFNGFSQESEFTKMMREMYQDEFADVMNENMNLSDSDNAAFQPIFTGFIEELGIVMDKKLVSQRKFADYFDGMTDEQSKTILKEVSANTKSYNKLISRYTKRVSKAIGAQSAFRFFLIVEKVKSSFDFATIQNIPLVEN